nr:family 20 glycosylhydrolase [Clostridia bacterium]
KYLASMKYNQVTVGVYGCWGYQYDNIIQEYLYIPFKGYPQLQTPRQIKYYSVAERKWIYKKNILPTMFTDDYFGDLVAYGKKHNIKVKPLFNSLGHNTLIPRIIPEISAKDENGELTGRGFCTSNPETYKVMFDLYDEIIDRYLAPNGVDAMEIGMDEVSVNNFCKCEKCREKSHGDIIIDYVIELCKHLKAKGMKSVYIYHDMIMGLDVINGTNQFEHAITHEEIFNRFKEADVADVAVIDWWSYSTDPNLFRGKELSTYFRAITTPFNG